MNRYRVSMAAGCCHRVPRGETTLFSQKEGKRRERRPFANEAAKEERRRDS